MPINGEHPQFKLNVDDEICAQLARRSIVATAIYFVLYICICSLTSIYADYPSRTLAIGGLLFVFGTARLYLALQLTKMRRAVWRPLIYTAILFGSSTWGLFCYLTVMSYGPSQNSLILLFTTAGIASGAILSLVTFRLVLAHLALILLPNITAFAVAPHDIAIVYQVLTTIYFSYLVVQAHAISKSLVGDLFKQQVIMNQNIALAEANKNATTAKMAKEQFLANISHEIRTPLNGVIGTTELLLDTNLDSEQKKYAQVIYGSGSTLLSLVNEILDLSKIEAGKMRFENISFSLRSIIERQVELLTPKAQEKNLILTSTVSPRLPTHISGDPGRIGQILLNLIGNAIKFTNAGSIMVRALDVTKPTTSQSVTVRFEVEDTGIGIAPESIHSLFQPFEQIDGSTARKFGGTGLGLSICKHFVEKMGGQIGVTTRPQKGSLFWFELPFAMAEVCEVPISTKKTTTVQPTGHRVLIADDVDTNLMLTTKLLQRLGYDVVGVKSGREAIQALEHSHFDIVLMDCQMPDMDGFEATHAIRSMAHPRMKTIPIIALTANAMEGDKDRCLAAGMNDYLAKPFKKDSLSATLTKWLKNAATRAS